MNEEIVNYKNSILEALQTKNSTMLIQLVPAIDGEEAIFYIRQWDDMCHKIMFRIINSQSVDELGNQSDEILNELLKKSQINSYHR